MEALAIDAGRDRHDALRRDPGGDHDRADALAAGDDPIRESIDQGAPASDRDRDVAGANDRSAERLGGGAAEPAVDGAMGVDHAYGALAHEPSKPEESAEVGRAAHADRFGRDRQGPGFGEQGTIGLADDQSA